MPAFPGSGSGWRRGALATVTLALALTTATTPTLAADASSETPVALAGGKVVSVAEAHKLLGTKTAVFIDTRSAVNFGKGHVPGAIAIPYKGSSEDSATFDAAKDQFDLAKLPGNKSQALVFYSDGPSGWKSYKAAVWAIKAGHKNVNYMRSGWVDWTAKGLPAE